MSVKFFRSLVDLVKDWKILSSRELIRLAQEIELRFAPLETQREDVDTAIKDLRNVALSRINEVLTPAIQSVLDVQARGFLMARSDSVGTFGAGNILTLIVTDDAERQLFTPSPFTILTRVSTSDDYAVARTISYDQEFGEYVCEVIDFTGNPGPHNDWVIGAIAGSTLAQLNLLERGETARDITLAARDVATAARDVAVAARDVTTAARDTALTARDTTLGYRDTALTYRNAAQTYRDQAEAFASQLDAQNLLTKAGNLSDLTDIVLAVQNLGLPAAKQLVPALPSSDVSVDFNTLLTPGWHDRLVRGNNPNGWGGTDYVYLLVLKYSSGAYTQIGFGYASSRAIRWRHYSSSTWSAWTNIGGPTVSTAAPSGGVDGDVWYQV